MRGKSLTGWVNDTIEGMKFVLEIEVPEENAVDELQRILRYWGGNLKHYEVKPGDTSVIYDSAYAEVGAWRIE